MATMSGKFIRTRGSLSAHITLEFRGKNKDGKDSKWMQRGSGYNVEIVSERRCHMEWSENSK